jgi:predicted Fe-Mo cluster-binding NifX family protein
MKIAVSAKGKDLEAEVDPRFGRAAFIMIVDTDTLDYEALDNSANSNAFKGAGIQAAGMVADHKAEVLLTGHCGPKAFSALKAAGVKVANEASGTVREAVQAFQDGRFSYAQDADVGGHW